jgi:ribulose-bisphosphate carboxylase large chain
VSPSSGISHFALYGQIARLAGADAVVIPHLGGRFAFGEPDCRAIAEGTAVPMGGLAQSFPAPAGGLRLEGVPALCDFYGGELVVLVGGDARRLGLEEGCRRLLDTVRAWSETQGAPR